VKKRSWCVAFGITWSLQSVAFAQAWPAKPVRFLVGNAAGGSDDFIVRTLTPKLAEIFGQPFVVDNRPGAGSLIAYNALLNAPNDGHTILLAGQGSALRRFFDANMSFDPLRAFSHTALLATTSTVLVVNPSVKANNVTEFIALARAQPGKFSVGELGGAGMTTISPIIFRAVTKVNLLPVPYKDFNPLQVDLIAGRLDSYFGSFTVYAPHIAAGRLRALGVTGAKRSAVLPDVPTIAEAGVPNFEASGWLHIAAPAGTPQGVLDSLNSAMARIIAMPDVRESLIRKAGSEPTTDSREGLAKRMTTAMEKFDRVTKELGIKPQ
jgi:tripartite-type tricarboxylate transporter receptor subunit TctC